MNLAIKRVFPIGLALAPIGVLFGILAAQANWNALEVFLLSLIGFTGSGQFAFLMFSNQGLENIGLLSVFLIILSINLRYLPMTFSASQPLQTSKINKLLLAHWLADESYATEEVHDDIKARFIIRISIMLFWTVSTVIGVMLAAILPLFVHNWLVGLTFPVSAILSILSFYRINNYIIYRLEQRTRRLIQSLICFMLAIIFMLILGEKYFWIPSIIISYIFLIQKPVKQK